MNNSLERFRIANLHGNKNIDARIEDNTLILVGENGSGKTTFLRILFHFLSGRWLPLIQFKFESIIATVNGTEYRVTHESLTKAFKGIDKRFLADVPSTVRRRVLGHVEKGEIDRAVRELERLGIRYSSPTSLLIRQFDFFSDPSRSSNKELHESTERIRKAINSQILYLPTYRRIERELGSIFEGIDPEDFRNYRKRVRQNESSDAYIELVEFGMTDVQQAIGKTLDMLKEFARESLNNLTLRYLGDVVNQEYQSVGMKEISNVNEETVSAVLDRINESILTNTHKSHLFGVINSARAADSPTEHEMIICHYFLKLLGFQQSLQENEAQISAFCELCSKYIVDKQFVYNSQTFSFSIVPTDQSGSLAREIELSDLSSGEKQIVSLFSHLYLSGQKDFFVLIDEPELSLSVPWQRRFLSDIRSGAFCSGIVAVTHSPFIYDNSLKKYAHSLGEFMS